MRSTSFSSASFAFVFLSSSGAWTVLVFWAKPYSFWLLDDRFVKAVLLRVFNLFLKLLWVYVFTLSLLRLPEIEWVQNWLLIFFALFLKHHGCEFRFRFRHVGVRGYRWDNSLSWSPLGLRGIGDGGENNPGAMSSNLSFFRLHRF